MFEFDDRKLDLEQTIKLARDGLEKSNFLKDKHFAKLTAGFAGSNVADLDERLAWIMSFRTVYSAPPPILWLGSVVTSEDDDKRHLICMRPRCDCVRLDGETAFIFLPLAEPHKKLKTQLVVKLDAEFERLGIELDSASLIHRRFKPSGNRRPIVATEQKSRDGFEFSDTDGRRYIWRGELKAEQAQRIAQAFATTMSRVAVDESELAKKDGKKVMDIRETRGSSDPVGQ